MKTPELTHESVVDFVLNKVAMRTKTPREELHGDTQLAEVGLDSLNAVLVCGYLEDEYKIEVEPLIMFQYKTANEVATAVLQMVAEQ